MPDNRSNHQTRPRFGRSEHGQQEDPWVMTGTMVGDEQLYPSFAMPTTRLGGADGSTTYSLPKNKTKDVVSYHQHKLGGRKATREWICSTCSYVNADNSNKKCSICGTRMKLEAGDDHDGVAQNKRNFVVKLEKLTPPVRYRRGGVPSSSGEPETTATTRKLPPSQMPNSENRSRDNDHLNLSQSQPHSSNQRGAYRSRYQNDDATNGIWLGNEGNNNRLPSKPSTRLLTTGRSVSEGDHPPISKRNPGSFVRPQLTRKDSKLHFHQSWTPSSSDDGEIANLMPALQAGSSNNGGDDDDDQVDSSHQIPATAAPVINDRRQLFAHIYGREAQHHENATATNNGQANDSNNRRKELAMSFAKWTKDDLKDAWECQVCTFVNQNALHLTCEMCGERRDAANGATTTTRRSEDDEDVLLLQQRTLSSGSSSSTDAMKQMKKERLEELIQMQQELLQEFQNSTTSTTPSPENDPLSDHSSQQSAGRRMNREDSTRRLRHLSREYSRIISFHQQEIEHRDAQRALQVRRRSQIEQEEGPQAFHDEGRDEHHNPEHYTFTQKETNHQTPKKIGVDRRQEFQQQGGTNKNTSRNLSTRALEWVGEQQRLDEWNEELQNQSFQLDQVRAEQERLWKLYAKSTNHAS